MKKTFLLFLITLLSVFVQAQERRYVILDSVYNPDLNYSHVVSEYHGYPIESFNVFLDKEKSTIALLSVLKPIYEANITWQYINLDTIQNKILSTDSLERILYNKWYYSFDDPRSILHHYNIKVAHCYPIIKKGEHYLKPILADDVCTLELFRVEDNSKDKNSYHLYLTHERKPDYIMDISGQVMPILEFEQKFMTKFGAYSDNYPAESPIAMENNCFIRANDTVFNGKTAYRFWVLGQWIADDLSIDRGIERLTYVPEYGIIAGAYTPYFLDKARFYRMRRRILARNAADEIEYKDSSKYFNFVKPHLGHDYLHNIQSTPLRIELNGKLVYEKKK